MNHRLIISTGVLSLVAFGLVACTSYTRTGVRSSFGDAVNANVEAQLYDPSAARNPSMEPVEATDGQRMEAVMDNHRNQSGSAESVSNPIVISVGQ